jgi:hypothetical protein
LHLKNLEALHLLLQLLDLFFQAGRLGFERLGRLMPIGGDEFVADGSGIHLGNPGSSENGSLNK